MQAEQKEDLSRPSVTVRMPEVRLTMQDLGYLRSLANPEGLRCHPGGGTVDRLRFLDLIGRAKVQPPKEDRDKTHKEVADTKALLRAAIQQEDWEKVSNLASNIKYALRGIEPKEQDVLTVKGKQLLRQGDVTVKVRKVGCVPK